MYAQKAADLTDDALDEAHRLLKARYNEAELLVVMLGGLFWGDGDYLGNEFIVGLVKKLSFVSIILDVEN